MQDNSKKAYILNEFKREKMLLLWERMKNLGQWDIFEVHQSLFNILIFEALS